MAWAEVLFPEAIGFHRIMKLGLLVRAMLALHTEADGPVS